MITNKINSPIQIKSNIHEQDIQEKKHSNNQSKSKMFNLTNNYGNES